MKKVIYLGHYDIPENKAENRVYWLAATNKMDYIIDAIHRNGYEVTILSASRTRNSTYCPGHTYKIGSNKQLVLFPCTGLKGVFSKVLRCLESIFYLSKFILANVKKGDAIIVYHSLSYASLVRLLRYVKKFKLIIEVNELYSDVSQSNYERKKEVRFFNAADAFIFSTELLEKKINTTNKPYVINYGTYKVECGEDTFFRNEAEDIIHLVYAGTFSRKRGAAEKVVLTAKYLPSTYHIHLIGTGDEVEKNEIEKLANQISKGQNAKVSFDGLLEGNEYINFLHSCDGGFSTQNANAKFNDSSFPSKVLSYLSNGLRVISVRIPVIEKSMVNDLIYYYEGDEPESIAKTIKQIDWKGEYDSKTLIKKLDEEFVRRIGGLLDEQIV